MNKKYDVTSICNALVDIVIQCNEGDLTKFSLTKGQMHLCDQKKQEQILTYFF